MAAIFCSISTCRERSRFSDKLPDATSIFILPPDRKTLEERLRKRSEDREEVIHRRLVTASREIEDFTAIQLHSRERPFGGIHQEFASHRASRTPAPLRAAALQ